MLIKIILTTEITEHTEKNFFSINVCIFILNFLRTLMSSNFSFLCVLCDLRGNIFFNNLLSSKSLPTLTCRQVT